MNLKEKIPSISALVAALYFGEKIVLLGDGGMAYAGVIAESGDNINKNTVGFRCFSPQHVSKIPGTMQNAPK
jgi:hypothetical protein